MKKNFLMLCIFLRIIAVFDSGFSMQIQESFHLADKADQFDEVVELQESLVSTSLDPAVLLLKKKPAFSILQGKSRRARNLKLCFGVDVLEDKEVEAEEEDSCTNQDLLADDAFEESLGCSLPRTVSFFGNLAQLSGQSCLSEDCSEAFGSFDLFGVADAGDYLEVQRLLELFPGEVNILDASNQTPLIRAVIICSKGLFAISPQDRVLLERRRAYYRVIELLLGRGANLEIEDNCGKTALLHAIEGDDQEMIQFLWLQGADIYSRCGAALENNWCFTTPFIFATKNHKMNALKALYALASQGHRESDKKMRAVGNLLDTEDFFGKTAFYYAAESQNNALLQLLVGFAEDACLSD